MAGNKESRTQQIRVQGGTESTYPNNTRNLITRCAH